MNNLILKSISASNFRPFKEKCYFTTESNISKKELLDRNTIEMREERYNKVSYIYGINGAGKTNLCRVISQIQKLIMLSPIIASNNPQLLELQPFKDELNSKVNYFKLAKGCNEEATEFGIELIMNGITYSYSFKILNDNIIEEILKKKNKRTEIILNRTSSHYDDIILKSELSSFKANISVVKENVLCLSMAAFLNNPFATELVKAIDSIKVINMSSMLGIKNLSREEYNQENIDKYLKILKLADPTLKDLKVSFTESKIEKQKMGADDFENRELVISNISVDVKSIHNIYDGDEITDEIELPFLKIESNGTIRMLNIIPNLINTLENGGILVIDEIENGLHPNLVKILIDYFYNKDINKNNAQLICTSHNMLLVEKNVRRDQVWVISKNKYGQSYLKRLTDFKIRIGENLSQKLLKEAFGDFPKIEY